MNLDEINNRIKPVIKKVLILALYILLFWIVLPFLLVVSSLLLDRRFSFAREPTLLMICLGTALLAFAVPMLIAAITQFRKFGKRLPVSATPAPVLIQKGLFAVWRHPIYLFFTLSFIGISLVLGSMGMLLVTIPVFICLVYLYLRVEERYLIKRFGRTYENFRDKTPLVIPHFYQFLRIPGFILFKYLFSFEVRNRENIPDTSPFFVVSSHRNYLDPFYISVAIPYRISFITTYEVFRNAVTRYILRKFSAIPKKRHLHDVQTGRHIVRMLERDAVIGVFPEGERTWTGRMISFKPETLNLFKKFHHVPVLPVKLEGNFFAWPRWGNGFRKAKVTVTIQPPIRVDPGMDHGSVEAHLKSLIEPDDASDPRLFCRSGKRAGDITRV
ncbi:MAG: 1-acyl-sn-glycerol-3-phosphate acyltransferase, partial [Bacteroidales bacterium]|nr:1-acyl-sn-glycerol-3-phosphate acyltransferase [Bacteroidales bacterium]